MIIDTHVHFSDEPGFAEKHAAECARLGIAKAWLLGGRWQKDRIEGGILDALRQHPGLYRGFGMLQLGRDPADAVTAFHDAGFAGLKCICPAARYDDRGYYRLYERAERLGMPILFHLGIVARSAQDKYRDVDCDRMRPVYLDTIGRAFPGLTIIGAHFGNPWSDEAAMIARWNPNVFFDLSGSILKYRPPEFFRQLLWWGGHNPTYQAPDKSQPWDKILFGSDVATGTIAEVIEDYRRTMTAVGLDEAAQQKVWSGNAARILTK